MKHNLLSICIALLLTGCGSDSGKEAPTTEQPVIVDPAAPIDSDSDGVADDVDAFPLDPTETIDTDEDGVGDNADVFPLDPDETIDTDGDGVGDNADGFPNDPNEQGRLSKINATVIDGYLQGATVWVDLNNNYQQDQDEPWAISGVSGQVEIDVSQVDEDINVKHHSLRATAIKGQAIDESLGLSGGYIIDDIFLSAPAGSFILSPLTTAVDIKIQASTIAEQVLSVEQATAELATQLQIEPTTIMTNYMATSDESEVNVANAKAQRLAAGLISSRVNPRNSNEIKGLLADVAEFNDDLNSISDVFVQRSLTHPDSHFIVIKNSSEQFIADFDDDQDGVAQFEDYDDDDIEHWLAVPGSIADKDEDGVTNNDELAQKTNPNISNSSPYTVNLIEDFTEISASDNSEFDDSLAAQLSIKKDQYTTLFIESYSGEPIYDNDSGEAVFHNFQMNFAIENMFCSNYQTNLTYGISSSKDTRSIKVSKVVNEELTVIKEETFLGSMGLYDTIDETIEMTSENNVKEIIRIDGKKLWLKSFGISASCDLFDTDLDGLLDNHEQLIGTDPTAVDTDRDGFTDAEEIKYGLNPTDSGDGEEADTDSDGINNRTETELGLSPIDASDAIADNDSDGISNRDEIENGLDINNPNDSMLDNDNDGVTNRREIADGTDINDPTDYDPNHLSEDLLERAITTGNVGDVTQTELYEALDKVFRDSLQQEAKLRSDIYQLGTEDAITSLSWNPSHDSVWFNSPDSLQNQVLAVTNASHKKATSVEKPIIIMGSTEHSKYALFGGNPMVVDKSEAMNTVFKNIIAKLTQVDDLAKAPLNVVVAHIPDKSYFYHDGPTHEWLSTHLPSADINAEDACESFELASCLDGADLLVLGHAGASGDKDVSTSDLSQTLATVRAAQAKGLPVLYLHYGRSVNTLSAGLFTDAHVTATNNYYQQDKLVDFDPSLSQQEISKEEVLINTLKEQTLSYSDYQSCVENGDMTTLDQCKEPTWLESFYTPLKTLKTTFNSFDTSGLAIFEGGGYRLYKLVSLLGDRFRVGGVEVDAIDYPIDLAYQPQQVAQGQFADLVVYNTRDYQAKQTDLGSFICPRGQVKNNTCENYRVEEITRHNTTFSVPMRPTTQWTTSGVYALPGVPFTATRTDNGSKRVGVIINYHRNKTTRSASPGKYDRPQYPKTPVMWLTQGEPLTITSPYGGPVYLYYESNAELEGQVASVDFSDVGQHASIMDIADEDKVSAFIDDVKSNPLPHIDIASFAFEAHARKDKFINTADGAHYQGDYQRFFVDYQDNFVNTVYNLAGFKLDGKTLEQSLSADVQSVCNSNSWDCYDVDLHQRKSIQHVEYVQDAQCGGGCSGNPFSSSGNMNPTGWLESHELGHNLQVGRLNIAYAAQGNEDDWTKYASRATENSNNIFPYYVKWNFARNINNNQVEYHEGHSNHKLAFALVQSVNAGLTSEIDGEERQVLFNQKCAMVADYALDATNILHEYIYQSNEYATRNNERMSVYIQMGVLNDKAIMADGTQLQNGFDIFTLLYAQQRLFGAAAQNEQNWLAQRESLGFSLMPYSGHEVYGGRNVSGIPGNDFLVVALAKLTGKDWRAFFDLRAIPYSSLASAQVDALSTRGSIGNAFVANKSGTAMPGLDMSELWMGISERVEVDSSEARWPIDNFHPSDCLTPQ